MAIFFIAGMGKYKINQDYDFEVRGPLLDFFGSGYAFAIAFTASSNFGGYNVSFGSSFVWAVT
jgi:hypothetical protein